MKTACCSTPGPIVASLGAADVLTLKALLHGHRVELLVAPAVGSLLWQPSPAPLSRPL